MEPDMASGDRAAEMEKEEGRNEESLERSNPSLTEPSQQTEGDQGPQYEDLRLDTLPTEILLHICSFLDAKFVIHTLSVVCQLFHTIMNNNRFWKVRIGKRWPQKYPAIPVNDSEFDWKKACIAREEQHRMWTDHANQMDYFKFKEGLYASVDAVHIMPNKNILATGSRDRYLNLFDLSKLDKEDPESVKKAHILAKNEAHKGWVWSLSSLGDILASGSWDKRISFWDVGIGGQQIRTLKALSAILCTHYEENYFIAGGYDKRVYHIDPRVAEILRHESYHTQPVLTLAADDNFILTGSEDKKVKIYDRRAAKVYKTLAFNTFPMTLSYGRDQLWVGDKGGKLHLYDATDGDFNIVETYDVGHSAKVVGVQHTLGAIFTCSMAGLIKVLEPSLNPATIATFEQEEKTSLAGLDFRDDILATANSNISVGVWMPKKHH